MPAEDSDQITDLDKITKSNFHDFMKLRLETAPESRTPDDLEVLKHCTKFLGFFQNIIHEDPLDSLKSH